MADGCSGSSSLLAASLDVVAAVAVRHFAFAFDLARFLLDDVCCGSCGSSSRAVFPRLGLLRVRLL